MAEAVMRALLSKAGMAERVIVESAGTHAIVGAPPYIQTQETLQRYRVPSATSLSRQLEYDDLNTFNYVLAMDRKNLTFMLRHSAGCRADVRLFLGFAQTAGTVISDEVKDPFPDGDYDEAYRQIHAGCVALLSQVTEK